MALTGESSRHLSSFNLSKIDTQKERRNFPGRDEKQYYTLEEIRQGDAGGTSDTDRFTSPDDSDERGYTTIYKKHGPFGRPYPTQMPHVKEN